MTTVASDGVFSFLSEFCTDPTQADTINSDLLAFLKQEDTTLAAQSGGQR